MMRKPQQERDEKSSVILKEWEMVAEGERASGIADTRSISTFG